jgi:hypothetical protein
MVNKTIMKVKRIQQTYTGRRGRGIRRGMIDIRYLINLRWRYGVVAFE